MFIKLLQTEEDLYSSMVVNCDSFNFKEQLDSSCLTFHTQTLTEKDFKRLSG